MFFLWKNRLECRFSLYFPPLYFFFFFLLICLITAGHSPELPIFLIAGDLCEINLLLQRFTTGHSNINAPQSITAFMTAFTTALIPEHPVVPRRYRTFSSAINVSLLIDGLYCNYLLESRNEIIRKGLQGRKVLTQWELWGGNWNAEGDKVHGSPQNSVSANGKEGGDLQEESMIRANSILMM